MSDLIDQVGAAVRQIKAQFPDPDDVGSRASNDAMVAHLKAQVTAWQVQVNGMTLLAQEKLKQVLRP